uniref:Uncharacterized protein n=1 Tax=Candidatus Kentrum eta TaxID=2126337 RepID=A0A450UMT3_9GAMM|nr:MAG: hypothetical protein BECKH772A_GA0070896_1006211 [Candidatus Kentron sp. H]VFJ94572.1 MAG: hypothetical protein BECKH772B_GA0070898_1006311 [Candidatus Kentron sp. H]VFK01115.1 MAG: hypothetical protein BECKH772C_GA0070978_1005811 [Candidatus Kentron sp. H]
MTRRWRRHGLPERDVEGLARIANRLIGGGCGPPGPDAGGRILFQGDTLPAMADRVSSIYYESSAMAGIPAAIAGNSSAMEERFPAVAERASFTS